MYFAVFNIVLKRWGYAPDQGSANVFCNMPKKIPDIFGFMSHIVSVEIATVAQKQP